MHGRIYVYIVSQVSSRPHVHYYHRSIAPRVCAVELICTLLVENNLSVENLHRLKICMDSGSLKRTETENFSFIHRIFDPVPKTPLGSG